MAFLSLSLISPIIPFASEPSEKVPTTRSKAWLIISSTLPSGPRSADAEGLTVETRTVSPCMACNVFSGLIKKSGNSLSYLTKPNPLSLA